MKDETCIFCKIANGEIPSATVYEDEDFRVILDLGPASEGHALILPKNHFKDVCELDAETSAKVLPLAAKIGAAMKLSLIHIFNIRYCTRTIFNTRDGSPTYIYCQGFQLG